MLNEKDINEFMLDINKWIIKESKLSKSFYTSSSNLVSVTGDSAINMSGPMTKKNFMNNFIIFLYILYILYIFPISFIIK